MIVKMKWFKQLFCKHDWKYKNQCLVDFSRKKFTVKVCSKCEKIKVE